MSLISIEHLLQPVSPGNPSGEDISEMTEYYVLEDLVAGAGPGTGGEASAEARWPKVLDATTELLQHGKELRVSVHLIHALLCLDGLPGLRDGLQFLERLLSGFWDTLYPALDAEEEHPAMARMNMLRELSSGAVSGEAVSGFVSALREARICTSRQLGAFTWRDVQLATGEVPAPDGVAVPQIALIEGAIRDTDPGVLAATVQALEESIACIGAMDTFLTQKLTTGNTAQLAKLGRLLTRILARVQGSQGAVEARADLSPAPGPAAVPGAPPAPLGGAPGVRVITSHDDVIKALDAICVWYEAHERASPVPYLLKRAKRLVGQDFMAIVKDVARNAEEQVRELFGGGDQGT